jgi:hypothetical protein
MFPFHVNRTWYEEAWLTERPEPSTAWKASVIAARAAGIVAVLFLGLRSFGHF